MSRRLPLKLDVLLNRACSYLRNTDLNTLRTGENDYLLEIIGAAYEEKVQRRITKGHYDQFIHELRSYARGIRYNKIESHAPNIVSVKEYNDYIKRYRLNTDSVRKRFFAHL